MAAHRRTRGRHRASRRAPLFRPASPNSAVRRSVTAAALAAALTAPAQAHASTLISIGATGSWANTPVTALQQWHYTHGFPDDPVTATAVVEYPASLGFIGMPMGESVAEGTAALLRAVTSISGRKVIVCESQGCLSVTELLQRFAADPAGAPTAGELTLVMIGNPATAGGGASAQSPGEYEPFFRITFIGPTPEGPYHTVNVTREYDFFADRPADTTNALAMINNLAAFLRVHPYYGDVDMADPDNLVKVVGNTTYVLVPTEQLPMLQSLYAVAETWATLTGQSDLLDEVKALDARLRAIIDADYDRSGYVPQGLPSSTDGGAPPPADSVQADTTRSHDAQRNAATAVPAGPSGDFTGAAETISSQRISEEFEPAAPNQESASAISDDDGSGGADAGALGNRGDGPGGHNATDDRSPDQGSPDESIDRGTAEADSGGMEQHSDRPESDTGRPGSADGDTSATE